MISSSPFDLILRIKLWEIKNDFFSSFFQKNFRLFCKQQLSEFFSEKREKITFPQTISIFTLNHPFYYHLRISRHSKGTLASIIHSRIRIRTGVEHVYHDASLNLERSAKEFCLAYTRLDFRGAFFLSITALHSSKRIHPFSRSAERQNSLSPLLSPLLRVITRKRAPSCVP